ncbi:MAG TPA: transposase, partial [Gammaproteobacteria bacterium]|nr:transposase [Gammaproteobacteria bacterium]
PSPRAAKRRWNQWYRMALDSGIAPVIAFARRLEKYAHGIIASARHRLNTSVLEGINNRIKVIKRMAYGYRDSNYFFVKIRAAFPGKT